MSEETKVLDEDGAILLTSNIKTLADATYPANAAIASPYNSSISYIVGSYCLHNGLLYKCNTDIPVGGEVWTAAHWTQVNLGNELALDRKMQFTSVVVDKTSFVQDTTYEDFPYRAAVPLTGVKVSMYPEVVLDVADSMSGIYAPVVQSYNGGIYLYANTQPMHDLIISSIVCWIRGINLESGGSLNIADEIQTIEDDIDEIGNTVDEIQEDVALIQSIVLKRDLLWENASPTSDFAAQEIVCDTSYDSYEILYRYSSNIEGMGTAVLNGNIGNYIHMLFFSGTESDFNGVLAMFKRNAAKSANGITFSAGYLSQQGGAWTTSYSANKCFPLYIYGIKGVITQ